MGKARTMRFEDDIDPAVDRFIEKNDINFNKLVNLAVKEFISKPHTIELLPVDEAEWDNNIGPFCESYFLRHLIESLLIRINGTA